MAKFEGKTFKGELVVLDDNVYVRCKFIDCTLSFSGGAYTTIECRFEGTFSLSLSGHSANTLQLFQNLATVGPEMRSYIIGMLDPRNTQDSSKAN